MADGSWVLEAIETAAETRVVEQIHDQSSLSLQEFKGELSIHFRLGLPDLEDWESVGFREKQLLASIAAGLVDDARRAKEPDYCDEPETYVARQQADLVAAIRRLADKVEALPLPE